MGRTDFIYQHEVTNIYFSPITKKMYFCRRIFFDKFVLFINKLSNEKID